MKIIRGNFPSVGTFDSRIWHPAWRTNPSQWSPRRKGRGCGLQRGSKISAVSFPPPPRWTTTPPPPPAWPNPTLETNRRRRKWKRGRESAGVVSVCLRRDDDVGVAVRHPRPRRSLSSQKRRKRSGDGGGGGGGGDERTIRFCWARRPARKMTFCDVSCGKRNESSAFRPRRCKFGNMPSL